MIGLIDYGLGNLASVRNALRAVGAEVEVVSGREGVERAGGLVLPGVGAAPAGMQRLRAAGLDQSICRAVEEGRPVLGICLGMQLLFERSAEGDATCLGLLPGSVRRLRGTKKIPHMGWNQVAIREDRQLWAGLPADPYVYFVHSYACDPATDDLVAGTTEYGETFCSAVARGPVWGTQFHPERSGRTGLQLLRNFVRRCETAGEAGDLRNSTARF